MDSTTTKVRRGRPPKRNFDDTPSGGWLNFSNACAFLDIGPTKMNELISDGVFGTSNAGSTSGHYFRKRDLEQYRMRYFRQNQEVHRDHAC